MKLSQLQQTFVLHFGEMGSRWGINRTVGQIYALLYLSEKPLNADDICEALSFSRSNVSMGLKELDSWQLIRLKHLPEDRRDYYTTPEDVWEIVRTLIEQRRKREIEPTMTMLRDVLMENQGNPDEQYAQGKLLEMHNLIEMFTDWYNEMQQMNNERIADLLKLGPKVFKLYEIKDKFNILSRPGKPKEMKCKRDEINA
jgi:DNA-binding transcriptional regulator GbsR (MarR family)